MRQPEVGQESCLNAKGGTIMPGLIEAHIHLTYFNVTELQDPDIKFPVEYVTLQGGVIKAGTMIQPPSI